MDRVKNKISKMSPESLIKWLWLIQVVSLNIVAMVLPLEKTIMPETGVPNFLHLYCITYMLFLWVVSTPIACLAVWAAKRTKKVFYKMIAASYAIPPIVFALVFTVGFFMELIKLLLNLI